MQPLNPDRSGRDVFRPEYLISPDGCPRPCAPRTLVVVCGMDLRVTIDQTTTGTRSAGLAPAPGSRRLSEKLRQRTRPYIAYIG